MYSILYTICNTIYTILYILYYIYTGDVSTFDWTDFLDEDMQYQGNTHILIHTHIILSYLVYIICIPSIAIHVYLPYNTIYNIISLSICIYTYYIYLLYTYYTNIS